jgi:hypothetical protein
MPVVKLGTPITTEGRTVERIEMRKLKVADLEWLQEQSKRGKLAVRVEYELIARLSGLAPDALTELDADDFAALSTALQEMFPEGLRPSAR